MAANVVRETQIFTPIFVQAFDVFEDRSLEIRSLTKNDELCNKTVRFLVENQFPFYRNGEGYTEEEAIDAVRHLRARLENKNPFSGYAVVDTKTHRVAGLIRMDFDRGHIGIAGLEGEKYQHQGNGAKALEWVLKDYFPMLHKNGYRYPVFEDGQIKKWKNLDDVRVFAETHPDNEPTVRLLENAGFSLVREHVIEGFKGVHDGRRLRYEIDLYRFIHPDANRVCKVWHAI